MISGKEVIFNFAFAAALFIAIGVVLCKEANAQTHPEKPFSVIPLETSSNLNESAVGQ